MVFYSKKKGSSVLIYFFTVGYQTPL